VNADLDTLYLSGNFVDESDFASFYSNPRADTRLMPSFAQ